MRRFIKVEAKNLKRSVRSTEDSSFFETFFLVPFPREKQRTFEAPLFKTSTENFGRSSASNCAFFNALLLLYYSLIKLPTI